MPFEREHHPPLSLLRTTRFAPSPTGYLHLGHAASALYVWGIGRALGARVILRIEDHDRGRSRPQYEAAIIEDLRWLGFEWDNGPADGPLRQSERESFYLDALAQLKRTRLLYGCSCTRKEVLADMAARGLSENGELHYGGTCRTANKGLGKDLGWRLALEANDETFDDLLLGWQIQNPMKQCGDLLLRDRHGNWTYQFAVTVDDIHQGVDLIVRGQDLLESTGRQLQLARMLGRADAPRILHHPLIVDGEGAKLSKRFFSEALAERRAKGSRPEELLGEAAHAVGLTPSPAPLSQRDVEQIFKDFVAELGQSRGDRSMRDLSERGDK